MTCDVQSYQMDKKASQSDNSPAVGSSRELCGFDFSHRFRPSFRTVLLVSNFK